MATGSSDGDEMVPAGVLGGHDCPPSRTFVRRGDELIRVKPHRMQMLEHGDEVIKLSSGGAGIGKPTEREPEAVRRDVVNEFITVEAARRIYGVVIEPERLTVDDEATAELRGGELEPIEVAIDEQALSVGLREAQRSRRRANHASNPITADP
jgi:N-methylhydantoinase B/oxoprolinase/acetone carboxylase alpha subunit